MPIVTDEKRNFGMLIRVIVTYLAWIMMVFENIPAFISVVIVVAAPMLFGSVVWHLRKTRSLSVVNRVAFCSAVAFFPFFAIQIVAMRRL